MERYKYTVTNLKDLQSGSATARSFCEQLHRRSFAVIKLPVEALADITAVRNSASTFFALPADSKRTAVGDFRQVGGTYAGYRDLAGSARQSDCDAEFLEVHVDRAGAAVPAPPEPPALAAAAAALHARLLAVARALLGLLADHIQAPAGALLDPVDPPSPELLDEGQISSSVLRVCHYRARVAGDGENGAGADRGVLFAEHTDSALLTLSLLCPGAAGLEVCDASVSSDAADDGAADPWVALEELCPRHAELDVEVHVGDFLAFLTRDYYPACCHRVLRPAGDAGRLSLPFLVRCRNDHVLDTRPYDPTSSNARLVEVHGVTCKELRLLFDARGKRLLEAERDAAAAAAEKEEERKRRAREYREALKAGKALSDSSDED